jgi:hypothetical protein
VAKAGKKRTEAKAEAQGKRVLATNMTDTQKEYLELIEKTAGPQELGDDPKYGYFRSRYVDLIEGYADINIGETWRLIKETKNNGDHPGYKFLPRTTYEYFVAHADRLFDRVCDADVAKHTARLPRHGIGGRVAPLAWLAEKWTYRKSNTAKTWQHGRANQQGD